MATTTEVAPKGPMPVMTRAKRGGRAEPEPESKQASSRFGRVTGSNIQIGDPDAPTWWQWLDSLTEDEWKRSICYWYRTGPVTDRQSAGKPTSIEKWGGKFDQNDVKSRHGSGRYRFDFCYIAPGSQKYVRVAQEYETIMDLACPPQVPLGEWIDNPANKDWEWAKPLLKAAEVQREQTAAEKIAGKPQTQQNPVEQLSETIDLAQKLLPKDNNTAILIELLKQQDPTKMLGLAKEIAALNQPQANGDGSMQMMFMKFLLEEMKEARQLRAQPQENPLKVATELLTGAKSLFENMGVGGPAAPVKLDTGAVIVQQAGEVIGKVVDGLGQHIPSILGLLQHLKDRDLQIAQIAAARNMNPQRPFEYAGPTATPAVSQPQPSAPAPSPSEPQQMTVPVFFTKYQALLQRNLPFLTDHFANEDGYVFQDHIIDREGRNQFNEIRKDASVDLLMQLVQGHHQLREMFHPPEKARQFFEEFLSDPDQEPVPADGAAGAEAASPEAN